MGGFCASAPSPADRKDLIRKASMGRNGAVRLHGQHWKSWPSSTRGAALGEESAFELIWDSLAFGANKRGREPRGVRWP